MTKDGKIEVFQGDDLKIDSELLDDNNEPISLEGCTVFFTVTKYLDEKDDSKAIIKKNYDDFSGYEEGNFSIFLTSTDTFKPLGKYFYNIKIKDPQNKFSSTMYDDFIIKPNTTKRRK